MPPEWMWLLDEELNNHFEWVKDERDARYGNPSRAKRDDDGLMMRNEYAKGRGRNVGR